MRLYWCLKTSKIESNSKLNNTRKTFIGIYNGGSNAVGLNNCNHWFKSRNSAKNVNTGVSNEFVVIDRVIFILTV